jgi:hypothetical protein
MARQRPCPRPDLEAHVLQRWRIRGRGNGVLSSPLGASMAELPDVLHLNVECEAECSSCLHIAWASPGRLHGEPHVSRLQ